MGKHQVAAVQCAGHTCVVDHDGVVDPVRGVVDLVRARGVDHLDLEPIHHQRVLLLVDLHGAVKGAVNRIKTETRGPLCQITRLARPEHHRPENQPRHARPVGEEPAQEPPDPAKAVENAISRGGGARARCSKGRRWELIRETLGGLRSEEGSPSSEVDL